MLIIGLSLYITSCGTVSEKFRDGFNREYESRDRGGFNTVVSGTGCSIIPTKAENSAKKAAEYHLRSVLGNARYLPEFKQIQKYQDGEKTCVVIKAFPRKP